MEKRLSFVVALLTAAISICGPSIAIAGDNSPPRRAPGIVISLEGGIPGESLAVVLDDIGKIDGAMQTEPYVVKLGDNLCAILTSRNFPPPCGNIINIVSRLNPQANLATSGLEVGQTLQLPKLDIQTYRAVNHYDYISKQRETSELNRLAKQYRDLDASVAEFSRGRQSLTYDAFNVYIPTRDDATAQRIFDLLVTRSSRNMSVEVLRSAPAPTKLNALADKTVEQIKDLCLSGGFDKSVYSYGDLVDPDSDASEVVKANLPAKPETVRVVLIDTPIAPAPNLSTALGTEGPAAGSAWKCAWLEFNPNLHHANHLAGIMASQKEFGFVGLASNSHIDSFVWARPIDGGTKLEPSRIDRAQALKQTILDCDDCKIFPPRVFLAATDFDRFDPSKPASTILENANTRRFGSAIGQTIRNSKPLLVVAAGQDNLQISPKSNMPPQIYGDLQNVIVVTACSDCSRKSARIMDQANLPLDGSYTIHVAAPGGRPIPGWLTPKQMGAGGGTSQASAYVAGVAASMIGAFPSAYAFPSQIKIRIQATSRPFAPMDGNPSPESSKLTAGVVDPVLSLLDPTKHWYKTSTGWREAAKWSGGNVKLEALSDMREIPVKSSAVLRIFSMGDIESVARYTVYEDLNATDPQIEPGTVRRNELVAIKSQVSVTDCDGSKVSISDIIDFIPALTLATAEHPRCHTKP